MPKRRADGEGTITQRKDKSGKKLNLWQAQFTDFTGKRRTVYGKTQQEALKKMKEAQGKSDMGVTMDGDKLVFTDWIDRWLEVYIRPTVKESTYSNYHICIHKHIIPAFPGVLMKDLKPAMLQKFINDKSVGGRADKIRDPETGEKVFKSGGLSKSVLNQMKMLIILSLKAAIDNGLILKNVAENIKLQKSKPPDVEVLSVDEQKRLEELLINDNHPLSFCILLDLYTGLRVGELTALKVSDINLDEKELYVHRTAKRVYVRGEKNKTKILFSDPKTEKSKRAVPLPDFIVEMLKAFIAERDEYIIVLTECLSNGLDKWTDNGYLFITRNGDIQEQSNIRRYFNRKLDQAGIKHIKLHALRHTFATRCIEAGFDIRSLADILGHTDVSMTLKVYTHSLQEQKRKNMERLAPLYIPKPEDGE